MNQPRGARSPSAPGAPAAVAGLRRVHHYIEQYGYAGLFGLLALGVVGLPFPDETLLAIAGALVRRGELHPVFTVLTAAAGGLCGLSVSFLLGRTLGSTALHRLAPWLHVTEAQLARFHLWYERWGRWLIAFGYFVPGVRHVVAILAGASGMHFRAFLPFAAIGAVLWVCTFLTLGYALGRHWEAASLPARIAALCLGGVLACGWLAAALVRRRRLRHRLKSA